MLDVYITIDTEFWPRSEFHESGNFRDDFERDIIGRTGAGDFGIEYQADMLSEHGLQAVFFVEPLCALAVGDDAVRATVEAVQSRGHDVQLHMHTEWLEYMDEPVLGDRRGLHTRHFSSDEQSRLIRIARDKIESCGAVDITAFRAGNFGANLDTLAALNENGINIDSSYNQCFLDTACRIEAPSTLLRESTINGVTEYPVTCFRDFTGRSRPLQLTATSFSEFRHVMLRAHERGWTSVVIVSHSFELIRGRKDGIVARPDKIVIERFEKLCRFLSQNTDKFRTATFAVKPAAPISDQSGTEELRCPALPTLGRLAEQAVRRFR